MRQDAPALDSRTLENYFILESRQPRILDPNKINRRIPPSHSSDDDIVEILVREPAHYPIPLLRLA